MNLRWKQKQPDSTRLTLQQQAMTDNGIDWEDVPMVGADDQPLAEHPRQQRKRPEQDRK